MKVVIIGFMGSGKTTVAELVAGRLGVRRVEMDDLVLARSGEASISAIFDRRGEAAFRALEQEAARELSTAQDIVLSTGGGVVSNQETIRLLKSGDAVVIYLQTSFAEIRKRLTGTTDRPLFRDAARAEALYAAREGLYRSAATEIVVTDGRTPGEVADLICTQLALTPGVSR